MIIGDKGLCTIVHAELVRLGHGLQGVPMRLVASTEILRLTELVIASAILCRHSTARWTALLSKLDKATLACLEHL